jgi:hypothetical protein
MKQLTENLSLRDLKAKIQHKFKLSIIMDMLDFFKANPKKFEKMKTLMGNEKGRKSFQEEYLYLTLYKYSYNIGFHISGIL